MHLPKSLPLVLAIASCTTNVEIVDESDEATEGTSITDTHRLTGCRGQASSTIPSDGRYVVTVFGGAGDTQPMSCGGRADGTWYYAASRQRYGCGSRVAIRANGKCVVAQTDDYGPDVCVERAAGMPIIDVSPAVTRYLFGSSSFGWSDRVVVAVDEVSAGTALGPCTDGPPPPPDEDGAPCYSSTLDREVSAGTCVRAAGDGNWYECAAGAWQSRASSTGCAVAYGYCNSATLGTAVPARTCVQAASDSEWYQCNGSIWAQPVDAAAEVGPIGACSTTHPL
jgi:hypothetical protein